MALTRTRTGKRSWLRLGGLILLVSVLFGMFEVMQIYIAGNMLDMEVTTWDALSDLLTWLIFAAMVPFALLMASWVPILPTKEGSQGRAGVRIRWKAWILHGIAAIIFAALHLAGSATVLAIASGRGEFWMRILYQYQLFFTLDVLTYCAIVGAHHAVGHHQRAIEEAEVNAELRGMLAETRLDALKRQLQPHFLFNTLNALASFALRGEREAIVETLGRLADLLRLTLDDQLGDEVTLQKELSLLERYISLQQLRFGDRLTVDYEIAPDTSHLLVPTLLLQPLVENALQHGIAQQPGPGWIRVESRIEDGDLALVVLDSGPGFKDGESTRTDQGGIGLSNTRARLAALHGDRADLFVGRGEGGRVTVVLPLKEGSLDEAKAPLS